MSVSFQSRAVLLHMALKMPNEKRSSDIEILQHGAVSFLIVVPEYILEWRMNGAIHQDIHEMNLLTFTRMMKMRCGETYQQDNNSQLSALLVPKEENKFAEMARFITELKENN